MKFIQVLLLCCLFSIPFITRSEEYVFSGGENSLIQSVASVILVKAYKKAGIKIKPIFLGLQDSLQQSNAGITDGEIARVAAITKFTPNLKKVPVPIMSLDAVAFSKNTSIKINNWSDLNGHKFTIVNGVKFIEVATKQFDRMSAASFEEALEFLESNKTEIVVTSKIAFVNVMYKKKYHDIKAISSSLKRLKLYHFVHVKNEKLIPVITPILQNMLDSGEIAHIKKTQLNMASRHFIFKKE
jgi:polar amino acid transport system substrate-binding protein